jgi:TRAP-type uncharacterized transport system fused permease subunit
MGARERGSMGAWDYLVLVLVLLLVLEEAVSYRLSAVSQTSSLVLLFILLLVLILVLVLETHHDDTTTRRRFPWHGHPAFAKAMAGKWINGMERKSGIRSIRSILSKKAFFRAGARLRARARGAGGLRGEWFYLR